MDTAYRSAIASVPLSRYLCERTRNLTPGTLLDKHDFPLLMARLVEEPPRTRRRSVTDAHAGGGGGSTAAAVWEKLDDGGNGWGAVPPADLLRLTRLEGELWLAIFHVVASGVCRGLYQVNGYRRSRLMRLWGYVNEALVDQLPILVDVAQCLNKMSILGGGGDLSSPPPPPPLSSGTSLLQRANTLRESVAGGRRLDGGHWETIAQRQWVMIFSWVTDSKDKDLRLIAEEVYGGAVDA